MTLDPKPIWFGQLKWMPPVKFVDLVVNSKWPGGIEAEGAGLYIFSKLNGGLKKGVVLYVGKAAGKKQTLRRRIGVYVGRMRRAVPPKKPHAGMEMLCDFYGKTPHSLYIRWAGVAIADELEGRFHEFYEPPMNVRYEEYTFEDDEMIPLEYLGP